MVDLTTERPFWKVKAEYASFTEFLRDVSEREDHVRDGRGRQLVTSYCAGLARVRLIEDRAALINIFRPLRTLTDCVGTLLVWGRGEVVEAMQARYGGDWTDACAPCYLDEKYDGLAWQPHWTEEEAGWVQAWAYVWETAELDRAFTAAWTKHPDTNLVTLYQKVWAAWWASLPAQMVGSEQVAGFSKIVA
jgi:hypothetical protein